MDSQLQSPNQLFSAGAILLQSSQLPWLDFSQEVDDHYGIDPDGPISTGINKDSRESFAFLRKRSVIPQGSSQSLCFL